MAKRRDRKNIWTDKEFEYYCALIQLKKQGVKSVNGYSIETAIGLLRGAS